MKDPQIALTTRALEEDQNNNFLWRVEPAGKIHDIIQ